MIVSGEFNEPDGRVEWAMSASIAREIGLHLLPGLGHLILLGRPSVIQVLKINRILNSNSVL